MMKLAFYEAFQPNATILDKVIAVASGGSKSHVEGVFSDGQWFSISPRDKGARFKTIEPKEGSWTFIDLPFGSATEERIKAKCIDAEGTKYAYIGAILSATPFCLVRKNREFCSRLWANLLREEGYPLTHGCTYTPQELHDALVGLDHIRPGGWR